MSSTGGQGDGHPTTQVTLQGQSGSTGLVYDQRMAEHLCRWDPDYPECPERLTESWKRCVEYGLVDRCTRIPARYAKEDEVLTLHGMSHLETLKTTRGKEDDQELEKLCAQFDSIYIHPSTYDLALMAVGSTKDLVAAVVKGQVRNGMALVRPPGHHAMRSEFCGYCFFNNVAIATQYAIEVLAVKRCLPSWGLGSFGGFWGGFGGD